MSCGLRFLSLALHRTFFRGRTILLGDLPVELSQLFAGRSPNGAPQAFFLLIFTTAKRFLADFYGMRRPTRHGPTMAEPMVTVLRNT